MTYLRLTFLILVLCLTNFIYASNTSDPSLRDKIGQMLLIGFDGSSVTKDSLIVKEIEDFNLGGVILFDYNFQKKSFDKNIHNPSQVKKLNLDLQAYNHKAQEKFHRPSLDLLISIDYEGGKVSRLEEKAGFPATISAREVGKGSLEDAKLRAQAMAKTLKELNFSLDFAPVLDLDLNASSKIIRKKERSFSADPYKVAAFAEIYSKAFTKHSIFCAYKHFPGHGSASGDSHLGFVDVTKTWKPKELIPYKLLLDSNSACNMVMIAHIVNRNLDASGLPASLSKKIVTGLLRESLHFQGIIITDDMQMKAIANNYGLQEALVLTINAGTDMLIFGNNLSSKTQSTKELIDLIEAQVKAGKISEKRISEAYHHIVNFKRSLKNAN